MGGITIIHIQQHPVWISLGVSTLSVAVLKNTLKDRQFHCARILAALRTSCGYESIDNRITARHKTDINLLKTKRNLLYIRNQFLLRSKHFPPRL